MVALLSDFAGCPYPYPKYAQTLVHDFVAGGQENISATTLTRDTLHAAQDEPQAANVDAEPRGARVDATSGSATC